MESRGNSGDPLEAAHFVNVTLDKVLVLETPRYVGSSNFENETLNLKIQLEKDILRS